MHLAVADTGIQKGIHGMHGNSWGSGRRQKPPRYSKHQQNSHNTGVSQHSQPSQVGWPLLLNTKHSRHMVLCTVSATLSITCILLHHALGTPCSIETTVVTCSEMITFYLSLAGSFPVILPGSSNPGPVHVTGIPNESDWHEWTLAGRAVSGQSLLPFFGLGNLWFTV